MMIKKIMAASAALICTLTLCACNVSVNVNTQKSDEPVSLNILAAASLTDVCTELETMYEQEHPGTELTFSFASSGALQTQIEEGAPADIFFSASTKQMNALDEEGLMESDTITELLENKIVLVTPAGNEKGISSFEDAATDKVAIIGLGDPESVPAGQYAEEVFTSLGILDQVKGKANYGSDVRTVLTWVEEGEVDCGVVYQTDAFTTDKVEIISTAPEGSCKKVIYPAGIVKATSNMDASKELLEFFRSEEAMKVFEKYGF
jgi:molybdate transport system substrate-binding protein